MEAPEDDHDGNISYEQDAARLDLIHRLSTKALQASAKKLVVTPGDDELHLQPPRLDASVPSSNLKRKNTQLEHSTRAEQIIRSIDPGNTASHGKPDQTTPQVSAARGSTRHESRQHEAGKSGASQPLYPQAQACSTPLNPGYANHELADQGRPDQPGSRREEVDQLVNGQAQAASTPRALISYPHSLADLINPNRGAQPMQPAVRHDMPSQAMAPPPATPVHSTYQGGGNTGRSLTTPRKTANAPSKRGASSKAPLLYSTPSSHATTKKIWSSALAGTLLSAASRRGDTPPNTPQSQVQGESARSIASLLSSAEQPKKGVQASRYGAPGMSASWPSPLAQQGVLQKENGPVAFDPAASKQVFGGGAGGTTLTPVAGVRELLHGSSTAPSRGRGQQRHGTTPLTSHPTILSTAYNPVRDHNLLKSARTDANANMNTNPSTSISTILGADHNPSLSVGHQQLHCADHSVVPVGIVPPHREMDLARLLTTKPDQGQETEVDVIALLSIQVIFCVYSWLFLASARRAFLSNLPAKSPTIDPLITAMINNMESGLAGAAPTNTPSSLNSSAPAIDPLITAMINNMESGLARAAPTNTPSSLNSSAPAIDPLITAMINSMESGLTGAAPTNTHSTSNSSGEVLGSKVGSSSADPLSKRLQKLIAAQRRHTDHCVSHPYDPVSSSRSDGAPNAGASSTKPHE
eukprot:gene13582-19457_t